MTLQFSLREHKHYAAWNPVYTFSKATATIVRQATTNPSLGFGYIFVVVPRAWLDSKYIRWNWQGGASIAREVFYVRIYDGSYDRTSDVDFPSGAPRLIKGNGLLQTLDANTGSFGAETKDIQVDVSGGSEDDCTLFFDLRDAWGSHNFWEQIDWVEINGGAGGADNLYSEHFTDSVHMEREGTTGDYGYISTGTVSTVEDEELFAKFITRQIDSTELLAAFEARRDASAELFGAFIIRHDDSADLLGRFDGQATENLPATFKAQATVDLLGYFDGQITTNLSGLFEARRAASAELLAAFNIGQFIEDLLGELIVRQSDWKRLPAEFIIRRDDSAELLGYFKGQDSESLLGIFNAGQDSADLLIKLNAAALNEELLCSFISKNIGSADLLGVFRLRQEVLDLPAEFLIIRTTQQILPAKLVVAQSSEDLLGEFISRLSGSQSFPAFFSIVHSIDLGAGFEMRRINSVELLGVATLRRSASQELSAEFSVDNIDASDLLGEFVVRHAFTATGVIIAEDPYDILNVKKGIGTGFLENPMAGPDAEHKVIGSESYQFQIGYRPDEHDYILVGAMPKTWMQSDNPTELYSKYSLCPDLESELVVSPMTSANLCTLTYEMLVASPSVGINLCTFNREAMTPTPTSVYNLSTAVT